MAKKVLIVEDNTIIAYMHTKFTERLGGTVVGVTCNFEEFLSLVQKERPDIILMDILLDQDMDGIDFACRIPADITPKLVYVSGSTDPATLEKASQTPYHSFLIKPLAIESLKKIMEE